MGAVESSVDFNSTHPVVARAVTEAFALKSKISDDWDDCCDEGQDAVRKQVSLPALVRRARSSANLGRAISRRFVKLAQAELSPSTSPTSPAAEDELADMSDARDGHGAFPNIGQIQMQGLASNMLKLGGIFTPAANVLSMGMTVREMASGEQPHEPAESTRSAVSLAMDSLSLGLWAGSAACPPLAVAAIGVSAADLAVNVAYDFFTDAPQGVQSAEVGLALPAVPAESDSTAAV